MKRLTLFTFLYLALGVGFNIIWMIWEIQSQNWTVEAILQAFSRLIVVLLSAEIIVIAWQVNSEY